jgi:hypothetical protein
LAQLVLGDFLIESLDSGYLAAGWLMSNLPTWIAMGKNSLQDFKEQVKLFLDFLTIPSNCLLMLEMF